MQVEQIVPETSPLTKKLIIGAIIVGIIVLSVIFYRKYRTNSAAKK